MRAPTVSSSWRKFLSVSPVLFLLVVLQILQLPTAAQESHPESTVQPLITSAIDEAQTTVLKGNTHPLARAEFDLGTAPASLAMERMLLVLKRSPAQETALRKMLDDQQDKSSPNYHKWLTPEQFGKQFGPTDADLQTITAWLQSHGFQVGSTKGRTVLEFSGVASQVQQAFHTEIHKYVVNGEKHWANATDPAIPTALAGAVAGVESLNNFPRKPMNAPTGIFKRDDKNGKLVSTNSLFTYPGQYCTPANECYGLGPYDFATIYNLLPLWNAGIDGTGVTIAIVGESDIQMTDVEAFRSFFGLPANDPTFVWNGPDPGILGDESEADIDVQWSGGVAKGATIDFVVSQSTETTSGVDLSAVYIVEQNLAGIMSESYGFCELGLGTTGNQFYNELWQQASAQGITVFISAGDAGSAGCDNFDAQGPAPAQYGLQVSGYASTPYNVAVGGTDFNDFYNSTKYWSATNNPTTQESALGYIPETTWNDSCTNAIWGTISGFSSDPETNCNNSQLAGAVIPLGGSGGVSACTTPSGSTVSSCAGGYAKPSWQSGTGVPNDGKRDIPDVSLFASNGFLGDSYIICQADLAGSCPYSFAGFGGTSVSSPAFAGIMAMVNQKMGGRQGNANYVFYKLAAKETLSGCNSSNGPGSNCVFNDVTSGTIAMPCAKGSANCSTSHSGDAYGILSGYTAGTGYDLATGLGSVNAANLVNQWATLTALPSVTTITNLTPTSITHGQAVNFTVTVKPQTGNGAPSGTVSLEGSLTASNTPQGIAGFTLSNGSVSSSTELLSGGSYSVTAHYAGDATYAPSDSTPISVTVAKENSQPQVYLVTFDSNGNIVSHNTNTATYASPYLLRVDVDSSAGKLCAAVAASGATGCPTGSIMLTDDGNALDLGTYSLNSYGYFEDQFAQISGGTHTVKAAYAGDNSFNASTGSNTITITPASTSVSTPYAYGVMVGQSAQISVNVDTTSMGAAPSGTVNFYANGNSLPGTINYIPVAGNSSAPAYLQAILTSDPNAFSASGNYAITATYNGDLNYSPSTSSADNITVRYPTPFIQVSPTQTVSYGNQVAITALVDTTNKSAYPTGTVTFSTGQYGTILAGPITCTNAKDTNGNFGCQAVGTFTVTFGGSVFVNYSGDANYPSSYNWAYINMPDFTASPVESGGFMLTAGQSGNLTILFTSVSGYSGTVTNLSCSGLPAETSCSFNPTQLTLPANGSVSTTLTLSTTAIGQSRQHALNNSPAINLRLSGTMIMLGACFVAIPLSCRRRGITAMMLLAILVVLPSCGGGSGGGAGGGSSNPVPSISSLNPANVAAGSQIENLYINGTNFMSSSTVKLNGTVRNSSLQSPTQLQIPLEPGDVAAVGQYPVVVTNPGPGGGASAPVNFGVTTGTPTGIFNIVMSATSGPITHNITLGLTVQ